MQGLHAYAHQLVNRYHANLQMYTSIIIVKRRKSNENSFVFGLHERIRDILASKRLLGPYSSVRITYRLI